MGTPIGIVVSQWWLPAASAGNGAGVLPRARPLDDRPGLSQAKASVALLSLHDQASGECIGLDHALPLPERRLEAPASPPDWPHRAAPRCGTYSSARTSSSDPRSAARLRKPSRH